MHDMTTVSKLTDKQLQDLIVIIGQRLQGVSPNNQQTYELLCDQQELLRAALSERQYMAEFKRSAQANSINLTTDPLSELEDKANNETKNRK